MCLSQLYRLNGTSLIGLTRNAPCVGQHYQPSWWLLAATAGTPCDVRSSLPRPCPNHVYEDNLYANKSLMGDQKRVSHLIERLSFRRDAALYSFGLAAPSYCHRMRDKFSILELFSAELTAATSKLAFLRVFHVRFDAVSWKLLVCSLWNRPHLLKFYADLIVARTLCTFESAL